MVAVAGLLAGCGKGPSLATQGRQVFIDAGCGDCHRVAAIRGSGGSGPDFDTSEPLSRAEIRVELNAGVGGMPSYARRLSRRQEAAVTEFVFQTLAGQRKR
jgi:mono/diheme cytochrome c family protein